MTSSTVTNHPSSSVRTSGRFMHRAINLPNSNQAGSGGGAGQVARSLPMVVPAGILGAAGGSKPPFGVTEGPPELENDDTPDHDNILTSIQSIAKSLVVNSEPFGELPRRAMGSRFDL